MATACLISETGITTSVRSGVSNDIRRRSTFLASNRKWTGPVAIVRINELQLTHLEQ